MRRVHNDTGAPKSSISGGSPPPVMTTTASSRSKKRKHDKPVSSIPEKGDKASKSRTKKESREVGSSELYHEKYQRLLVSVQKLEDPRNTEYDECFANVYNHLNILQESGHALNESYYSQD